MRIWHMTGDARREPLRVAPGQAARLVIGSAPVQPGQSVWITYDIVRHGGITESGMLNVPWHHNTDDASYWAASFGPFERGDQVTYRVHGADGHERQELPPEHFTVGPRLYLALLWHQHQPSYVDLAHPPQGSLAQPWVRLHALRGYYAMAALSAEFPAVRVTFNLTPVLLWQIEQYVERGATDAALELTRTPASRLTPGQQEQLLQTFFEADWQSQILPFPRYLELYERRRAREPFGEEEMRDLQMWYNLAWFAPQFQEGEVTLPEGQTASVRRFIEQGGAFSESDIEAMLAQQHEILRSIVPLHRDLQARGLIEVSTSPFYHPILPLLYDTDSATIDRPGTCKPPRFHSPEDAEAQVARAVDYYRRQFGRPPRGMWPAEGAVSAETVPIYARAGIEWIASDQGVLERSGAYGYDVGNPDVLARPYLASADGYGLGIYFRDTGLSNLISFHYHRAYQDMGRAAEAWVQSVLEIVADRLAPQGDRVLTIILDGENTWNAYGTKAPTFLRALYRRLGDSPEIETVTPSAYLEGDGVRHVSEHPAAALDPVERLYTGSWIDEVGSCPGVDLGTWVGEPEENRAWSLLGAAHEALTQAGVTPATHPEALEALYMAEGSDWFWWLGTDHAGPHTPEFEALFRAHLANAYRLAGLKPAAALARPLIPWSLEWTITRRPEEMRPHERLTVRANCFGTVSWHAQPGDAQGEVVLQPVEGFGRVPAHYEATLGPFGDEVREVRLGFRCQEHTIEEAAACLVQEPLPAGR